MKTKEELNALKEEVKSVKEKLSALSEEELGQVTGGADDQSDTSKDGKHQIFKVSVDVGTQLLK